MKQTDFFGAAEWVGFDPAAVSVHARKSFSATNTAKAELLILGFGFFEAYLNGTPVSEDRFLPLNTDFHDREILIDGKDWGEKTAHRVYVCRFDVTPLIKDGENVLGVMLGNGWYAGREHAFGDKKLIFRLLLTEKNGTETEILSDETVLWKAGFVTEYRFTSFQTQDFTGYDDTWFLPGGSTDGFEKVGITDIPETEYLYSDCPADRISEIIIPKIIRSEIGKKTYDLGKNCSGIAVVSLNGKAGDTVKVTVGEEKTADNAVDEYLVWGQETSFICGGTPREAYTRYTWNNGRYVSVEGNAKLLRWEVIHTDTEVNSSFESTDINLKWLYDAFVNTQLCNMHAGIPSDCPHLERRGYTGDGELACDAAMETLDIRKFYEKWIADISDCQDRLSGHIQYTAPYVKSGGGPGGWGCAIVHVPYEYYKHYGDGSFMKELYPQMKEYFRYLDDHSENGLILSDREGEWCLGDWCVARGARVKILLPEPFVNDYFYIRSINEILECADVIGLSDAEKEALENKKAALIKAVNDTYFDPATGDYADNVQGANAFAVDLGLGDERTLTHTVEFYTDLGMYDTGIFGTDILTRVLFEKGYAPLAFELLTNDKMFSFGNLRLQGATSLWEYWTGRRSHSHPMFGAVVAYLFRYILGIRTDETGLVKIEPLYTGKDGEFSGSMTTLQGKVSVKVKYAGDKAEISVISPCDTELIFGGKEFNIPKNQSFCQCVSKEY